MDKRIEAPSRDEAVSILIDMEILHEENDPDMDIGLVLFFSSWAGEDDKTLSELSGVSVDKVFEITKELIGNGLFGRGYDHYRDYVEHEDSGIIFSGDIACGKGHSMRTSGDPVAWRVTEKGIRYVEEKLLGTDAAKAFMDKICSSQGITPEQWRNQIKNRGKQ